MGALWLCLSRDEARAQQSARDYTHYAFSVAPEHIEQVSERLRQNGVKEWKSNRSEGESLYFLDPDGHQLEIHAGDLASRGGMPGKTVSGHGVLLRRPGGAAAGRSIMLNVRG